MVGLFVNKLGLVGCEPGLNLLVAFAINDPVTTNSVVNYLVLQIVAPPSAIRVRVTVTLMVQFWGKI